MTMEVSIVVIGDELLIGQVVDTNSGFIAREMAPYGWQVRDVQVVGDDADEITSAIDRAFQHTRVVLTTGGLGPTKDDITKQALMGYFGGELQLVPEVLDNVREIFRRRGLELNDLTAAQALVPTSAEVIRNRVGTAPIMWFEDRIRECVLVAMPGVPFECSEMFSSEVFPRLRAKFPSVNAVAHHTMIVEGISESALAERIAEWESCLGEGCHLAYLPVPGYIRLRIDVHATPGGDDVEHRVSCLAEELKRECGEYFLCDGDLTPAELLLRELAARQLSVATAESCTGGNIAHLITSVPGSSQSMLGGVVAYSNEVKQALLGVSADTLSAHGAVSEPVVREMAEGVCRATGASVGIATSGIAGPGGATAGKPVGTVCIGIATPSVTRTYTFHFPGNRLRVIDRSSTTAVLRAVRLILQS